MSEAKLVAARELIQEKHYEAARAVLKTTNEPKAKEWLTKLDQIAPENPFHTATPSRTTSNEAEQYYKGENKKRRRRRLGNGIELIIAGIFAIGVAIAFSAPSIGGVAQQPANPLSGILFLGGIVCVIYGIITIARRNRD